MVAFPPSNKVAFSSTGCTTDLNQTYALLQSILGPFVLPSGLTYGGTDIGAINGMLSSAGVCHLLPGANYYLDAAVSFPVGAALHGHGAVLNTASSSNGGTVTVTGGLLTLANSSVTGVTVRDITLVDSYTSGLYGVYFLNASQSDPQHYLDHVGVQSFGLDGIYVASSTGSAASKLVGCKSLSCLGNGYTFGADIQATLCEAGGNAGHGFNVGVNNMLTSSKAWYSGHNAQTNTWASSTSCGIYVNQPYVTMVGNSCQQNALHGIELDGTTGAGAYSCSATANELDTNSCYTANVGHGIYINQASYCTVTGNTGGNNTGLGLGSQEYGIYMNGTCTQTIATPNGASGSAGYFYGGNTWTAPTLNTGFSAGSPPPGYKVVGDQVFLRGEINITATHGTYTVMFTLPSGARPSTYGQSYMTPNTLSGWTSGSSGSYGTVSTDNTGQVYCVAASSSGNVVSLDGIVINLS